MPIISKLNLNGTTYDLKAEASGAVSGVKGENEDEYRDGNVTITRENLGLGTAATRSVPTSGNANATQVVLGSDTRLTNSYNTADSASTTINDTDYIPMSETDGTKKKTLWSTIIAKIKAALATVATSGSYTDLTNKPSYAAAPSAGGAASNVYTPRSSNGDYNNDLPGANKTKIVEHGTSSPNRPSDQWYFVVTMQGSDTSYATQIAYGMTTTNNYIRVYQNSSWNAWKAFRNPTGNATAAQVLSGYTFSNASSDGLTGSMPYKDYRGQYSALATGHNSTGSYVYIPYGYYAPVENGDRTWFFLTDAQAQYMHKHTSTATPTGGDLNNSQYNLGEYHSYRYVNTAVCYNAGMHFGIESFLQGLSRTAYWFTVDNATGGTVTVSGNTAMFGNITYGIIVITNNNTQAFINLIIKYKTNFRFLDYYGGTNQNAYIESITANENSMIIRVASGTIEFFNAWVYNI